MKTKGKNKKYKLRKAKEMKRFDFGRERTEKGN